MSKLYKKNCDICGKYYERKNAKHCCSKACGYKYNGINKNSGVFKIGWSKGMWSKKFSKCIGCGTNEIKHGGKGFCKKCYAKHPNNIASVKKYRKSDKWKETKKKYDLKLRLEAMSHYSSGKPMCNCCGESDHRFLAFDHINGGGRKHILSINGYKLGQWLRKNGYPDGFQVLCHNCNMAKGIYGKCPHEKKNK